MFYNILILVFFYFLILFSAIGYGIFLSKISNIFFNDLSYGLIGLLGLFLLTLISYITNLFFPHNVIHNIIIIIVGLFFTFLNFLYAHSFVKEIKKIFIISLFFLVAIFLSKNNEDFPYYHFSYIANLTINKLEFGLAHLNTGFGTSSSIFYLNSLFYLPVIKYYLFHSSGLIILTFANIFLIDNCFLKKKNNNFIYVLSLISFVFINIIFSRLAEYGTDRAGQIIVFIIFIILFDIIKNKLFFLKKIKLLFFLIFYVASIKSYFIVYFSLIPIIIFVLLKKNLLKKIFKNYILFSLLIIFQLLYVFKNIANTGCIIYPLSFTCFYNLPWSVEPHVVNDLNHWFELWSKAGATPTYIVSNSHEYVKNFNWISNWIKNYFFTKGSDTLGAIFLIIIVFLITFRSRIKKKVDFSGYYLSLYSGIIILLLIWFNKHPDLRYGGYTLVALIFFIPTSFYLSQFSVTSSKKRTALIIVTIVIISFNIRNYIRIYSELSRTDDYKFINFPFFNDHNLLLKNETYPNFVKKNGYTFYLNK